MESEVYINNTAYMLIGESVKYLVGVLNSNLIGIYFPMISAGLGENANRYFKQYVEEIPVPHITNNNMEIVKGIMRITQNTVLSKVQNPDISTTSYEKEIDELVYELYEI